MSDFIIGIQEELRKLNDQRAIVEERLRNSPPGKLRSSSCRGQVQYYYCPDAGDHNGKYIPSGQTELVRALSQKEYDRKLLSNLDQRISRLKKLLTTYSITDSGILLHSLPLAKQKWITPIDPLWEDVLNKWLQIPYIGLDFRPEDPIFITKRGERVRSKSEKLLADYFADCNISYKYECPLELKTSNRTVYPDFTFLSPYTWEEVYLEHFGSMDDLQYATKTVSKIKDYERDHIYPGERLLMTFEVKNNPLKMSIVEDLVNKYLVL